MVEKKLHPSLIALRDSLRGQSLKKTVKVLGIDYELTVPRPEGDDWAAAHTIGATNLSAALSIGRAQLATSISSIGGVPVEQLFEMSKEDRESFGDDVAAVRNWRREQLLSFLREDMETWVVDQLQQGLSTLLSEHREMLKSLPNF